MEICPIHLPCMLNGCMPMRMMCITVHPGVFCCIVPMHYSRDGQRISRNANGYCWIPIRTNGGTLNIAQERAGIATEATDA